jgi:hypothetical protein
VWATADDVTRRNLYAVAMVQPEAYWAVGEAGTLVHSNDGGATWAVQPPPLDLTAALYGVRCRRCHSPLSPSPPSPHTHPMLHSPCGYSPQTAPVFRGFVVGCPRRMES